MKKENSSPLGWVLFVAKRYVQKKATRSSASSILSIFEIAAGVLALTIIIAVMNGFQLGYIESILEVSSYYVRVDNFPKTDTTLLKDIQNADGVTSVVSFKETEGIIRSTFSPAQTPVVIRGLEASTFDIDKGMRAHIKILDSINAPEDELLGADNAIMLGSELARSLGVGVGDSVEFLSINDLFSSEAVNEDSQFYITAIFKTGYYQYDAGWAFVNLDRSLALEGGKDRVTLGIKLQNRYHDLAAADEIETLVDNAFTPDDAARDGITISSWRDYNKAFFGALRTEKLMMFVLVGLIFVVVALNIFQAQRRSILERSEEIGLLGAIGASSFQVRCIFTFNGLLIGFTGATSGMALALLITTHIEQFFSGIEKIITKVLRIYYWISTGGLSSGQDFSIFNTKIFYLDGITARLMAQDVILIYLFGLLSAVFAAWFASKRTSKIKPAEILRYE